MAKHPEYPDSGGITEMPEYIGYNLKMLDISELFFYFFYILLFSMEMW